MADLASTLSRELGTLRVELHNVGQTLGVPPWWLSPSSTDVPTVSANGYSRSQVTSTVPDWNTRAVFAAHLCPCDACSQARRSTRDLADVEAQQAGFEERAKQYRERYEEQERRRREAYSKAERLLLDSLSEAQREEYLNRKTITVRGSDSKRLYRLHPKKIMNVELLHGDVLRPYEAFCAVPDEDYLPLPDVLLAQKLSIENDERAFLRVANRMVTTYPAFVSTDNGF